MRTWNREGWERKGRRARRELARIALRDGGPLRRGLAVMALEAAGVDAARGARAAADLARRAVVAP